MSEASRHLEGRHEADSGELAFVQALKARSPDAWNELFTETYERLHRYALVHVHSAEDAEDICSNVFVTALNRIDSYQYMGKPVVAWLYGIAQNLIRAHRRKTKRQSDSSAGELRTAGKGPFTDDNGSRTHLDLLDLRSAMAHLSPQQKEAIALLHLGGFRAVEVAAMLGKSERSIYYLEARALVRLQKVMETGESGGDAQ